MKVNRSRKRRIAYVIILGILFFFLVPIVPMTVYASAVLPQANTCVGKYGAVPPPRQVFASISYFTYGLIIASYLRVPTVQYGLYGLVYVPNDDGYTVQFPPLGFQQISCA